MSVPREGGSARLRRNQIDSSELLSQLQSDEAGFMKIAKRIKGISGLHLPLSPKNLSLVASRLHSIIRRYNMSGYEDYDGFLESASPDLVQEFVSALTTNTTQFFREEAHFQFLSTLLTRILDLKRREGSRELRVWCAASSTGQEPYSLAMTIRQVLAAYPSIQLKFLASDIDTEVLETASSGIYTADDLKSLQGLQRQRWMEKREDGDFEMRQEIKDSIRFAQFNLKSSPWPFQFKFDIIFCRNVLIYFDREDCAAIIDRMSQVLAPGGHLFLGHSESGMLRHPSLAAVGNAVGKKLGGK
jgi:chemotaxis protein methyltransferase CheR